MYLNYLYCFSNILGGLKRVKKRKKSFRAVPPAPSSNKSVQHIVHFTSLNKNKEVVGENDDVEPTTYVEQFEASLISQR